MDMESGVGTEEIVGSCNYNDATNIAKGKRTKRMRPLSPCAVAATVMTCSSSSASGDQVSGGGDCGSFSSTTTTATFEGPNQEEEDMANCLILLAQGGGDAHHKHQTKNHYCGGDGGGDENKKRAQRGGSSSGNNSRRFAEMPTATGSKIGFYIYECKTCNRTFPSFQALGGHRASHKKPKAMAEEKKPPPPPLPSPPPSTLITNYDFEEAGQFHIKSGNPPIFFQLGCSNGSTLHGNKSKVHECSICGSEFGSGQALGGHMRRHRATTNNSSQAVETMNACETSGTTTAAAAVDVKPRKVLQLDLNLPAPPEDDNRDSKFQFTAAKRSLVVSASPALVGCHY